MLKLTQNLLDQLEIERVAYCHWKSNCTLEDALNGIGDIDFLVAESDRERFEKLLGDVGFLNTVEIPMNRWPYMAHFYGMDEETGQLVHLHVYYKLMTAGALVKNHHFPFERDLLSSPLRSLGVRIPEPELELELLVVRKYLEHLSIPELRILNMDLPLVRAEIRWLLERSKSARVEQRLKQDFPFLSIHEFERLTELLLTGSVRQRLADAIKMGLRLRKWKDKFSLWVELQRGFYLAWLIFWYRVSRNVISRRISRPAALISFVGPEASGKTTLSRSLEEGLKSHFATAKFHCGKPPATLWTYPLRRAIALYVRLKRMRKKSRPSTAEIQKRESENRPHPLVSFLDAIDRWYLVKKLHRLKKRGVIVITDRYPSAEWDAIDGARIIPKGFFWGWLSKMERSIYEGMENTDLLIRVIAPLERTLERNRLRAVPEPDEFIRARHAQFLKQTWKASQTVTIDTGRPLEESLLEMKKAAWKVLSQR